MFIWQFWYLIAVAAVKLSILCLYGRLFSANRYPIAVRVLLGITIAWLVSFLFATFFQVWPIRCNWVACKPTTNYTLQRNRYCLGYHDSLPAGNIYPKTPIKPGTKTGLGRDFWVGHFVRFYLILMVWYRLIYMKAAALLPSPVSICSQVRAGEH